MSKKDEELDNIIKALTNGVYEQPYCRRVDGQMVVFVADEQEYCRVAFIDRYDEEIANAICVAGLMLNDKQKEIDRLTAALDKLARLGNEPYFGNSDGNVIAQQALKVEDKDNG